MPATAASTPLSEQPDAGKMSTWFDEVVATLRASELKLSAGLASPEEQDLFSKMIQGSTIELSTLVRRQAQQFFVQSILYRYLTGIKDALGRCNSLAFSFTDSEILVWAEIGDDDDKTETVLYTEEAKVNAEFHNHGFDMCLTIVEESDNLPIPSHYRIFKDSDKEHGKP